MEIHHTDKQKHTVLHRKWYTFDAGTQAANQIGITKLKTNSCSAIGRVASQHDVPRSEAASKAWRKCGDKCSESKSAWADKALQWEVLSSSLHFDRYQDCMIYRWSIRGGYNMTRRWKVGTMTPSPPWWAGRERSSPLVDQLEQVGNEGSRHHQVNRKALQT